MTGLFFRYLVIEEVVMSAISRNLPTTVHSLWGGSVTAYCFGAKSGNWALRGRTPADAEQANPGIVAKLNMLARIYGCTILSPHANEFNAEIVMPFMLTSQWSPTLKRGAVADAVVLNTPGMAFGVASGDCPTLILHDIETKITVASHAGRDCLFDRAHVLRGVPKRRFASVVDAMMTSLGVLGSNPPDIRAQILCGTGPLAFAHPYDHPDRGNENRRVVQHLLTTCGDACVLGPEERGLISLSEVIRAQIMRYGIHPSHIGYDGVDTHTEREMDGTFRWHSHRRDADGKRNFVLVMQNTR